MSTQLLSLDPKSLPPPAHPPVWLRARESSGAANHSPKGLLETQRRQGGLKGPSRKESYPWHPRVQKVEKTHRRLESQE